MFPNTIQSHPSYAFHFIHLAFAKVKSFPEALHTLQKKKKIFQPSSNSYTNSCPGNEIEIKEKAKNFHTPLDIVKK